MSAPPNIWDNTWSVQGLFQGDVGDMSGYRVKGLGFRIKGLGARGLTSMMENLTDLTYKGSYERRQKPRGQPYIHFDT